MSRSKSTGTALKRTITNAVTDAATNALAKIMTKSQSQVQRSQSHMHIKEHASQDNLSKKQANNIRRANSNLSGIPKRKSADTDMKMNSHSTITESSRYSHSSSFSKS